MLEDYWYPIDFTGFRVKEVNLLGREIIVWKVNNNYVAFQNRCPHRNAKLSMGRILDDRIKCPYHGWEFDFNGNLTYIPSHNSPANVILKRYNVKEKFGIVWISLNNQHDIPEFPEYYDLTFRKVTIGPFTFNANPFRVMDNFLDISHFPFVHEGILADPKYDKVNNYEVIVKEDEIIARNIRVYEPISESFVNYTFKVLNPLTLYFRKEYEDDKTFSTYISIFPASKDKSVVYGVVAFNRDIPEEKVLKLQSEIIEQDKVLLESLPNEFYLDEELHVVADKLSLVYRDWLKKRVGRRGELGLI